MRRHKPSGHWKHIYVINHHISSSHCGRGGGLYSRVRAPVAIWRLNHSPILHNLHLNSPGVRNTDNNGGSPASNICGCEVWGFVNALSRIRNRFFPSTIRLPVCPACARVPSKHSRPVFPPRACNFIIWARTEMTVDMFWKCFHVTLLSSQTPTFITRRVYMHIGLDWKIPLKDFLKHALHKRTMKEFLFNSKSP